MKTFAVINITRAEGDTFPFKFYLEEDGSPIDLSSATLTMEWTNGTKSASVIGSQTEVGRIEFSPSASDVDTAGVYSYSVKATDGSSVRTYVAGKLELVDI